MHNDDDGAIARPRVVLRPIGSPLPLGFLGLAVATLTVAGLNLGWVPTSEQYQVGLVLVTFAFPLQIVATVFGFLARDPVVASGIGVQAGTWLTLGLMLLLSTPGSTSATTGLFLFVAAAGLSSSVAVAAASKVVPALVMFGTVVRFVLTGVYERTAASGWEHAAGWEGLGLCILAIYTALAVDVESVRHDTLLPIGRFGAGKQALAGGPAEQVSNVVNEPGVRKQL